MSDTLVIQHECIVTERHCKTMPVHWVCSVCGRRRTDYEDSL
jgi:rubredoxin